MLVACAVLNVDVAIISAAAVNKVCKVLVIEFAP